jgi:hypothetical protein
MRKVTLPLQPAGIAGPPANDACTSPAIAVDGDQAFSTVGATTDGVPHAACLSFGDDNVNQDIWYNYTATNGIDPINISLCGSLYDTRVALYDGCGICPGSDANLIQCNDDACGLQSQISGLTLVAGNCYTIRIGGFTTATGTGNLSITYGAPPSPCGNAGHDCCTTGAPGCDDVDCCNAVCAADSFCCDTAWDALCVDQVDTLCAAPCPSPCNPDNKHDCNTPGGPGCSDVECCEAVCCIDAFCCDVAWDTLCVNQAATACGGGGVCDVTCPPGAVLELLPFSSPRRPDDGGGRSRSDL